MFLLRNYFTGASLIPFQLYPVFAGLLLTFSSSLQNDDMPIHCRALTQQYSRYGKILDCLVALLYTTVQISFPIICFYAFLVLIPANDIRASFVRINPNSDERRDKNFWLYPFSRNTIARHTLLLYTVPGVPEGTFPALFSTLQLIP